MNFQLNGWGVSVIKSEEEIKKLKTEAFKALACLRLEVHESIAKDVTDKVSALINALEVNLVYTESLHKGLHKKLDKILKAVEK